VVITADPITVGTDNIEFAQFAAAGQLSGGQNVSVSGDVIDVSPQGSGSGLDADTLDGQDSSEFVTNRYTDSEARSAVSGSTVDGTNFTNVDADEISGFEIQKNGTDGNGIINFKT
jgi:hypothetical protein